MGTPESPGKSEQELVARLRSGDQAAVDELLNWCAPRLYRFIFRIIGGNQDDAEDIMQETLIAAVRSLGRFRGDSGLFTWLCGIARRKIGDHIRRQKRRNTGLTEGDLDVYAVVADPDQLVERQVLEHEALRAALLRLSSEYRIVLVGKYIEGFTVKEIARIMGRSEKSVESLLTRARAALRDGVSEAV